MEPNIALRQIIRDQRIRILVVLDRPSIRSLVRGLIDSEPDMMVIGEADDEGSARHEVQMLKPDLVVMNLSMPIENAINATQQLRKDSAGCKDHSVYGF